MEQATLFNKEEVTSLIRAINRFEKASDGDSGDYENDMGHELADLVRTLLRKHYGTLS